GVRDVGRGIRPAGASPHHRRHRPPWILRRDDLVRHPARRVVSEAAVITWLASSARAVENERFIVHILAVLTVVMLLATLTFAVASVFWLALIAFWASRWVRITAHPLIVARVNRGLAPGVRATVLSMLGQAGAAGEVCGGSSAR